MHYPNNDLPLSNMITYKRHSQKDGSMSEKNGEKNLGLKQIDSIPNSPIREKTKVGDILKVITGVKSKWAGHERQRMDSKMCWVASQTREEVQRKAEKKEDVTMTSNNGKGQHGLEKREVDKSGGIWRRVTSSSGGV